MESLQTYLKIQTFFVWFGLFTVCCIQWCKGLVDGKSMFKLFGVLVAIGAGYEVVQIVLSHTASSSSQNTFSCTQGARGVFLSCGGWPIFSKSIAHIAEMVIQGNNYLYSSIQ